MSCPIQRRKEVHAALHRRDKLSYPVPASLRTLFSTVSLILCIIKTLCAVYIICQESHYVSILGNARRGTVFS